MRELDNTEPAYSLPKDGSHITTYFHRKREHTHFGKVLLSITRRFKIERDNSNGFSPKKQPYQKYFTILNDSRIADVELEGTDGVRLPGCKGFLSARSEVFERMLLGQFSESAESVVKVGYPGSVLKKLDDCYTDEVDLTDDQRQYYQ
jgi:hypothetical protein